jgi:hypothetical protein
MFVKKREAAGIVSGDVDSDTDASAAGRCPEMIPRSPEMARDEIEVLRDGPR